MKEKIRQTLKEHNVRDDKLVEALYKLAKPVEKAVTPKQKARLESKIDSYIDLIRSEEGTALYRIEKGVKAYMRAVDQWRKEEGDDRDKRMEYILNVHKECVKVLKRNIFYAVLDSLQTTDSVSLRKITKEKRGYADGYLSHYSQVLSALKNLRIKI